VTPAPVALDDAGEALWRAVLEAWTEAARHDAFVGHCTATMSLVGAAARYRQRLAAHPDDEIARKMTARIAFLATQSLRPSAPARPPLSRSPLFLIIIALAGVGGAILGLLHRAGR
jgi:hypothetical protein